LFFTDAKLKWGKAALHIREVDEVNAKLMEALAELQNVLK